MQLYYTGCGLHVLGGGFEDEDFAWRPSRPGQIGCPDGEWWGVSLTPAPEPWGMWDEHIICITIPDAIAQLYERWWDEELHPCEAETGVELDFLVPALILNQYQAIVLEDSA